MRAGLSDLPILVESPGMASRFAHWGELDIAVETMAAGRDATQLFHRVFPDGRCPVPHWGYLVQGRMRINYPDHEEVISAGEAWYMPPGHIPMTEEDVVDVVFSLAGEYEKVMAALARGSAG
jgi:hypothetical protein